MATRQLGAMVFTLKRSLKLAILWTAIFALPTWVLCDAYSKSKNIHTLLFALLLLSPAIYLFIISFFDKVTVHEKGVVVKSLFGTKAISLNTRTLIYIERSVDKMSGVAVARHAKIRLENNNESLKIPAGYKDLDSVIDYLQYFQQNVILPKAIEEFNENKQINFGILQLKKNGLIFKKKAYRWEEIEHIEVEGGFLRLFGYQTRLLGGADSATEVKNIANLQVCLTLLSQVVRITY